MVDTIVNKPEELKQLLCKQCRENPVAGMWNSPYCWKCIKKRCEWLGVVFDEKEEELIMGVFKGDDRS